MQGWGNVFFLLHLLSCVWRRSPPPWADVDVDGGCVILIWGKKVNMEMAMTGEKGWREGGNC